MSRSKYYYFLLEIALGLSHFITLLLIIPYKIYQRRATLAAALVADPCFYGADLEIKYSLKIFTQIESYESIIPNCVTISRCSRNFEKRDYLTV